MKYNTIKGMVLFCLLALGSNAAAANLITNTYRQHRSHFFVMGGIINGGTVRFDGESFESNIGLSCGAGFDIAANNWMYVGVIFDLHDAQIFEEREAMLNLSLAFKPVIYKHKKKVAYKPNIAVGFADLGGFNDIVQLEHTQYLTLKAGFEVVFFGRQKYVWTAEVGVWGSPYCFNNEYDITFGPIIQARIGVMFMN
ncbi:MAG: hypothetical protein ACOYVF_00130 [Candidatus Zixiibacteriota bacterium]